MRVQVLLWTALPLTILLIAVSLTGIGTHQSSMRSLADEEALAKAGGDEGGDGGEPEALAAKAQEYEGDEAQEEGEEEGMGECEGIVQRSRFNVQGWSGVEICRGLSGP